MRKRILIFMISALSIFNYSSQAQFVPECRNCTEVKGGIVRGDSTQKKVHLVFTGDEFGEGLPVIIKTLKERNIRGSFFFTGRFYRNPKFKPLIKKLSKAGHYLGPHSDAHLLYCDWKKRDSLLVTKDEFRKDMIRNLNAMNIRFPLKDKRYYIPPYEWWNDSIAVWSSEMGLQIISFTPGIRTNADYTYPEMPSYFSTDSILASIRTKLLKDPDSFNGAIILIHVGTDPRRKDKLYDRLDELLGLMEEEGIGYY